MSTANKKIGFWNIDFRTKNADRFFEKKLFLEFLKYMKGLPLENKIYDDKANNKAIGTVEFFDELLPNCESVAYIALYPPFRVTTA